MDLTDENKAAIDAMSYEDLLRKWRFAPAGDPLFAGPSADYVSEKMKKMRAEPGGMARHTAASKSIGW